MRVRYSFSSRKTGQLDSKNNHRKEFSKIVEEVIKDSNVVIEVLDARFVEETRNIEVEIEIRKNRKGIIYVLNKSDLIGKDKIKDIKEMLEIKNLKPYIFVSCKERRGKTHLKRTIEIEVKKYLKEERKVQVGVIEHPNTEERKVQVGVIGYPNTGKSSLINYLTGRGSAKTSAKAGFTRGIQKIRIAPGIVILDTPGVIPRIFYSTTEDEKVARHAELGARSYSDIKDPEFVVAKLMKNYPGILEKHYGIDAKGDSDVLIEKLGRKKNLLIKVGEVDSDRAARLIIKEWQEGKIKF